MYQKSDSSNDGQIYGYFGRNLKAIRKAKLTQRELAMKSGVKQSVISDLETGNAKSTGSILQDWLPHLVLPQKS